MRRALNGSWVSKPLFCQVASGITLSLRQAEGRPPCGYRQRACCGTHAEERRALTRERNPQWRQTILRFVQAAELRLDAPLTGAGPLSGNVRRIAEDATLIAWRRLVDACLEQGADFLLLTGTVFDSPATRRARKAFADGCAALAEYGIDVFVTDAALRAAELPANVQCLDPTGGASWQRNGREAVELCVLEPTAGIRDPMESEWVAGDDVGRLFRIGCWAGPLSATGETDLRAASATMDYISLPPSAGTESSGRPVQHAPGVLQGLTRAEAGPCGFSIVEVDAERRCDIASVVAAPVRWESCRLTVEAETTRETLIEQMQFALLDREPAVGEQVWLLEWALSGTGPLLESLADDAEFGRLCVEVESGLGGRTGLERIHRCTLTPRLNDGPHPLGSEYAAGLQAFDDRRWSELQGRLIERLQRQELDAVSAVMLGTRVERVRERAQRATQCWGERGTEGGVSA